MQLEGAISKDYFKVRDLLYKQYAIVWAASHMLDNILLGAICQCDITRELWPVYLLCPAEDIHLVLLTKIKYIFIRNNFVWVYLQRLMFDLVKIENNIATLLQHV